MRIVSQFEEEIASYTHPRSGVLLWFSFSLERKLITLLHRALSHLYPMTNQPKVFRLTHYKVVPKKVQESYFHVIIETANMIGWKQQRFLSLMIHDRHHDHKKQQINFFSFNLASTNKIFVLRRWCIINKILNILKTLKNNLIPSVPNFS